jgi:cell division septation protein DedD
MQPPAIEDPLAALDQLGDADEAAEGLTYHKALTHSASDKRTATKASAEPIVEAPRPAPAPKPEAPVRLPAAPSLASLPAAPSPMPPFAAGAMNGAAREVRPPLPAGKPQVVAAAPKKPDAKPAAGPRFTLQLSAFPERADAEEFMHKIQAAGYKPFLVASEIPGKGTFWRVRVGDYASKQAAADAKIEFERKQRMIAYVARL